MYSIFEQEKLAIIGMLCCFFLSLGFRLFLGLIYGRMIQEAENMATTDNKLLKQCKLKFTNCYQLNNGVPNIQIFVEKFLGRLALGPFSFRMLYHLSGQLMLLSVVFSGIGICRGIASGRMFGEILPLYICCLIELYLYFSFVTMVDVKGKRQTLKINLIDYLENHLSNRMQVTGADMQMLYGTSDTVAPVKDLELLPIAGWLADKEEKSREEEWGMEHADENRSTIARVSFEEAEALEELLKEFLSLS